MLISSILSLVFFIKSPCINSFPPYHPLSIFISLYYFALNGNIYSRYIQKVVYLGNLLLVRNGLWDIQFRPNNHFPRTDLLKKKH